MKIRARYVRYRNYIQLRRSPRFRKWLLEQATRLDMPTQRLFEKWMIKHGMSAAQVEAAPTPTTTPEGG